MRIVVDFTAAIGDRTGVGTYTRELVRALLREGHRLDLALNVFRHTGWARKATGFLSDCPKRWRLLPNRLIPPRVILEGCHHVGAPRVEDLFGKCDVFHGTNFIAPGGRRCRTVVTVHDLAFVKFADDLAVPHCYRRYIDRALERADRVIAVSKCTATDVRELFPDNAEKVRVVREGAPATLPRLSEPEFLAQRRLLGIPERYFLFVGTLEPRKNLVRLIGAYESMARRLPDPPGLVLAGRPGWGDREILTAIASASRRWPVRRVGFVSEPLRNSLYAGCTAFVFPSLYEGFGLPVLEAFAAGAPVIAARAGALPEVAGDAALLVDPEDLEAIADAMVLTATEEVTREDLIRRGSKQVLGFSWDRTARETHEAYTDE